MCLHVPNDSTTSGPFSELFLEESTPGSAATTTTASDVCPGPWPCWDLFQGLLKKDCMDDGLHIDAEDAGAIPSPATDLQWPFPFKAEVVFHQGYPAWRKDKPLGSL